MTNEEAYREFARLLGCPYECKPFPYRKRTRWNNRVPGEGRYPSHGIIRIFGETVHVALTNPAIQMIGTLDEVLKALARDTS